MRPQTLGSTNRGIVAVEKGRSLDADEKAAFEGYVARRLAREPTQYIVGRWGFHSIDIAVRSPVLVPRPETEELVDMILDWWGSSSPARFLDACCGSGCVGLALLESMPRGSSCVAFDIDDAAIDLSRENGRPYGEYYEVCRRSVFDPMPSGELPYDFIVSNPPYIPTRDLDTLAPEILQYESLLALDGGGDGLDLVDEIIDKAPTYLDPSSSRTLWLELDVSHPLILEQRRDKTVVVEGSKDSTDKPRFAKVVFR